MGDEPQPRRRISDRDRRRWNDSALDQIAERVEAADDRFAGLDRRISEVRTDLADIRRDIRELREEDRRHFQRNFKEHATVKQTTDQIAKTVAPSRMDWALKFATIVSLLLVPILAALVARGGT